MRLAIFENIMTPGGHEVDFDRILVEEFQKLGHEVCFYVPEGFVFHMDYHVPVQHLPGRSVSYTRARGLEKLLLSAKREVNRLRWYRELYRAALEPGIDAIIVPTSTYRYLRSLSLSVLRKSPVPIIFVLHGINPGEAPKFFRAAARLRPYQNIRMVVLTFGDAILGRRAAGVYPIFPPTFVPRDIAYEPGPADCSSAPLRIGFFGQYRKEKRLEDFLQAFLRGHYTQPVQLLVQGSTMHAEDAADFERIIAKYEGQANVTFLHKGLIGAAWQQAIADADVLLMPYSAPRYRYHWGGMLFTAIGFGKPVIASDDMNPEVFAKYHIGETFPSGDLTALSRTLEDFINHFAQRQAGYHAALAAAAAEFSPAQFARRLEAIIAGKA